MSKNYIDPRNVVRQSTGLTADELYVVVSHLNGVAPTGQVPGMAFSSESLASDLCNSTPYGDEELFDTASVPKAEREQLAADMAKKADAMQALAAKIAALPDDRAAFLEGYAAGFWAGTGAARREAAE